MLRFAIISKKKSLGLIGKSTRFKIWADCASFYMKRLPVFWKLLLPAVTFPLQLVRQFLSFFSKNGAHLFVTHVLHKPFWGSEISFEICWHYFWEFIIFFLDFFNIFVKLYFNNKKFSFAVSNITLTKTLVVC